MTTRKERKIPRSVFWGPLPRREERWRGQMSKVVGVRPDEVQLGYQLLLQGLGSGRCQDNGNASLWRSVPPEVVQKGCRHANALLRVTGSAFFFFPWKEVPSVSDSGTSAMYLGCRKQSCHFFASWDACILSPARLFVVMGDTKCSSYVCPICISIHLVQESMLPHSITHAAGPNKFSFSRLNTEWTKIQFSGVCLVCLKHKRLTRRGGIGK